MKTTSAGFTVWCNQLTAHLKFQGQRWMNVNCALYLSIFQGCEKIRVMVPFPVLALWRQKPWYPDMWGKKIICVSGSCTDYYCSHSGGWVLSVYITFLWSMQVFDGFLGSEEISRFLLYLYLCFLNSLSLKDTWPWRIEMLKLIV